MTTTGTLAVRADRANVMMGKQGFEFDLDSAIRFAKGLCDAGMVPKGLNNPGAVVGLIEAGRELGLAPMYALSNLTFTNGRLGIMGDAAKALIRAHGALKAGTDFEEIYEGEENTPEWKCTVTAHREGQPRPFTSTFSLQDAIIAKLARIWNGKVQSRTRDGYGDEGPWATYTKRMLMYRALGFLCRDRFSDILGGAVLMEELRDYPTTSDARQDGPPPGPDPLLQTATLAETFGAIEVSGVTVVGPPRADEPLAPTVAEPFQETIPPPQPTTAEATRASSSAPEIGDDEAATIAAIEKLEGAIVTAESLEALNRTWEAAAPLVNSLGEKQRKTITKLYTQNVAGFTAK